MPTLIESARMTLAGWLIPTKFRQAVGDHSQDLLLPDLPMRREAADVVRAASVSAQRTAEGLSLPFGMGAIDSDEYQYRRLTGTGGQALRRDLAPLAQDRMIEVCNFLWEQNCFAKRLVTLMTDLILGEGISVEAADMRNQEVIDRMWNHRVNAMASNVRRFYNALSVNGELVIPVATNPVNGTPTFGFLDPYQIRAVQTLPDNVMVPDVLHLKATGGGNGQQLKVIRENPATGRLEGECFFFSINALPNSVRGRSDLMVVADWLDLYDQYMFAEVERLSLLSNFVWDYTIEGATTAKEIADKLKAFPKPTPNQVFAHNEKEKLEARTPDLKAADRSEVARMMRVHIAGSMGYPISYLGDTDSNRATIEGQNDVMMKTPAARQKEFGSLVDLMVRFSVEQAQSRNRSLFRDVVNGYRIVMPEISAKDVSRIGSVMATVMTGMDTAMANRTMSRRAAAQVQVAVIKHLGVELDPSEVLEEADEDAATAQLENDQRAADVAAGNDRRNPPVPTDDDPEGDDPEDDDLPLNTVQEAIAKMERQIADLLIRPQEVKHVINVDVPKQEAPKVDVQVAAPHVTVEAAPAPTVNVTMPAAGGPTRKTIERNAQGQITGITEAPTTTTGENE